MPGPAPQGPEGRSSFFRKPAAPPVAVTPPPPPPPTVIVPPPPPPVPRAMEPPPPASGGAIHRLVFHGQGGSLFGIHIVNVLLTLVTLGVYSFWASRGCASISGDRPRSRAIASRITAPGASFFIGFLKAMRLLRAAALPALAPAGFHELGAAEVALRAPVLRHRQRVLPPGHRGGAAYRLSRTSWRGIRMSFRGSAQEFVKLFIVNTILTSITIGLWYPIFDVRRHAFLTNDSWFGNRKLGFDGTSSGAFRLFLLTLILTPFTLGLCLVLVRREEAALLLGPHDVRRRPLPLHRHRRGPPPADAGQPDHPHPHPRPRLALGAGPNGPLRRPLSHAGGPARPRADPAGRPRRLRDGEGLAGLLDAGGLDLG